MSEPKAVAAEAEEIAPRLWHWHVHDERIASLSAAHAVGTDEGTVLVDPLPLREERLADLGTPVAVCLTTSSHQRSAWRLRRELGVPVWAPALVREVDEEPDVRYQAGDRLPGGLEAIFTPGAGTAQHSFLWRERGGVLVTPDLFSHPPDGPLAFVPAQYMHDPEEARRSAEKLLDLEFEILCSGHGTPVTEDPKAQVRAALAGFP